MRSSCFRYRIVMTFSSFAGLRHAEPENKYFSRFPPLFPAFGMKPKGFWFESRWGSRTAPVGAKIAELTRFSPANLMEFCGVVYILPAIFPHVVPAKTLVGNLQNAEPVFGLQTAFGRKTFDESSSVRLLAKPQR